MSTSISWPPIGGTSYSIPAAGEVNWQALSNFLIALGNTAQSTVNTKFAIRTALTTPVTVATTTDCIVITDMTSPSAVTVNLPAGVTGQIFFIVDGKGDAASNNVTIDPNGAETINGSSTYVINKNRAGVVIGFSGTSWTILAEFTNIAAGTIPRSSIAAGSPNQVVINDGSGNLSSEATLAKSRGGTGADNSSVTFPSTGVIVTEAGTQTLTGKTIDGDDNTLQDIGISSLKTVLADANKSIRRNSSGAVVSGPLTVSDAGAQAGLISSNFTEGSAPSTPSSNTVVIYAKTDGKMYSKDDAGLESQLTAATVATPTATGTITTFVPTVASATYALSNAAYTILDTDGYDFITFDATNSTGRTITLPTLADNIGRRIAFKKVGTGSGVLTIDGEGSETIDGGLYQTLNQIGSYLVLEACAAEWKVLSVYDYMVADQSSLISVGSSGTTINALAVSADPGTWSAMGTINVRKNGASMTGGQFTNVGLSIVSTTIGDNFAQNDILQTTSATSISVVAGQNTRSIFTLTTQTNIRTCLMVEYSSGTPQYRGSMVIWRVG